MALFEEIKGYVNEVGVEKAAETFETTTKRITAWLKEDGKTRPDVDEVEKYLSLKGGNVSQTEVSDKKEAITKVTEDARLALCFPSYKYVNVATLRNVLTLALDLGRGKAVADIAADSLVVNARNRLADWFLNKTTAEWSFWMDDDMIVPLGRPSVYLNYAGIPDQENIVQKHIPEKVLYTHIIDRFVEHMSNGVKIVGAPYWGRHRHGRPLNQVGMETISGYESQKSGTGNLIETKWFGFGAVMIHREVFEGIKAKFPERQLQGQENKWFDFFRPPVGTDSGEDMEFCRLARECGFSPLIDTQALCLHMGANAWGPHNVVPPSR